MRTNVFHGVKLSLMAEDSNEAIPYTEFTPLTFWNIVYTGKSDHA
jgi:hypothetical protein